MLGGRAVSSRGICEGFGEKVTFQNTEARSCSQCLLQVPGIQHARKEHWGLWLPILLEPRAGFRKAPPLPPPVPAAPSGFFLGGPGYSRAYRYPGKGFKWPWSLGGGLRPL